jgi:hypothetical protein
VLHVHIGLHDGAAVKEIHVFPTDHASDHSLDQCWCRPVAEIAVDAETSEQLLITTHGNARADHVLVETEVEG